MTKPAAIIRVNVDVCNPGQFFACCGLLELSSRRWEDVEGCFEEGEHTFRIAGGGTLEELVRDIGSAELRQLDADDGTSTRIEIGEPFRRIRLDWWHELGGRRDGKELKVWAGSMESYGIARAMQHALRSPLFQSAALFDVGMIVPDPDDVSKKKKEPFYFDARRGPNAHSRDVGFSPNDLAMTTTAFPAVEFLCLVGLQRCFPAKTDEPRVFDYFTWSEPMPPSLVSAAVSGLLPHIGAQGYRFENWYRTGQRKHKAFRSAIPHSQQGAI